MSRIGRLPVAIPSGVEVKIADGNVVTVKGPKGTLERALPTEMEIKVEDGSGDCFQTKRLKENEISARFDQKPSPQYGSRRKRGIHKDP